MTKAEQIQSLIKQAQELPLRDKESLNALLQRADQVISEFYGNTAGYRADLKLIRFSPWSFHSNENEFKSSWNSGIRVLIDHLQAILEDPTVIAAPQELPKMASVETTAAIPSESTEKKKKPKKMIRAKLKAAALIKKFKKIVKPDRAPAVPETIAEPVQEPEIPPVEKLKIEPLQIVRPAVLPKIFLVHVGDRAERDLIANSIKKMGWEPVATKEAPHLQKSMMQKFTEFTDISCAVVILSADYFAYKKNDKPKDAKLRAAQDVVFETGILIGKFGRNRVFILHPDKPGFEIPSNYFDAVYIPLDKNENWLRELSQKLKSCEPGPDLGAQKKIDGSPTA